MDIWKVGLGLAGIALGVHSIRRGFGHLTEGSKTTGAMKGVERDPRQLTGKVIGKRPRLELREVRGLTDRINAIRERARKGRVDPKVVAWARQQVTRKRADGSWAVPEKDTVAEIHAIFNGMRRNVRYTSDILGIDTYVNPRRTLEEKAADCDDYSSLGCAALMAIGIPCRYEVIRTKDSSTWNHIFIVASKSKHRPFETGGVYLDASLPVKPGWVVPANMVAERRVFEVLP